MKKTRFVTVIAAICGVAGSAAAMAQKQTPPEGAPAKAFTVPAHKTYTLPNGLKVTLVPYGNIPKVAVILAVLMPRTAQESGRENLSRPDLTPA